MNGKDNFVPWEFFIHLDKTRQTASHSWTPWVLASPQPINKKKNQLQHGSLYILYIEFDLENKLKPLIPPRIFYTRKIKVSIIQSSRYKIIVSRL